MYIVSNFDHAHAKQLRKSGSTWYAGRNGDPGCYLRNGQILTITKEMLEYRGTGTWDRGQRGI